jgi:hypothetical protein
MIMAMKWTVGDQEIWMVYPMARVEFAGPRVIIDVRFVSILKRTPSTSTIMTRRPYSKFGNSL